jgi:hypothetical protein
MTRPKADVSRVLPSLAASSRRAQTSVTATKRAVEDAQQGFTASPIAILRMPEVEACSTSTASGGHSRIGALSPARPAAW